MINLPEVSVIIPCFNNNSTIIETIKSVKNQSFESIEIIIVNDGSTDNSCDTIKNYIAKNNSDCKLINQENNGPSSARNNGAKLAQGKYLLFIDADDLINKEYVSKCVDVLEKNKDTNIVYSNAEYFGLLKSKWELPNYKIENFLIDNTIYISAMIKRSVFEDVQGFDENLRFNEDWDLWIKIIKKYGGVYKIPEILFYYRKREDKSSLTDQKNIVEIAEKAKLYIYQKHYEFYKKNNYDLTSMMKRNDDAKHYKKKYYNIWYKKIFYKLLNKKKY